MAGKKGAKKPLTAKRPCKFVAAGAAVGALGVLVMSQGNGMVQMWGYEMLGTAYALPIMPYGLVLTPLGWLLNLLAGAVAGGLAGYALSRICNRA